MNGRCVPLFVSRFVPEQCGIATFTRDLADSVDLANGRVVSKIAAIRREEKLFFDDDRVAYIIENTQPGAYRKAALFANEYPCDLVSIQHEYGLYSGEWGEDILEFAKTCDKPLVTTLHTTLLDPPEKAKLIIKELGRLSARIVVMARRSIQLLTDVYNVKEEKIRWIPHGVPDVKFRHRALLKHELGADGRLVLLSFGLISPGKGFEYVIRALKNIARKRPNLLYMIVGQTHPVVKKRDGESYREKLKNLAVELGLEQNLEFVDRFPSAEELMLYIQAADICITPHLGRDQIVSGTLSYALAAGKAIISTPYLYAEEIAQDNALILAEFRDSDSIAGCIERILNDMSLRENLEREAFRLGKKMVWPNVGRQYTALFKEVTETARNSIAGGFKDADFEDNYQRFSTRRKKNTGGSLDMRQPDEN